MDERTVRQLLEQFSVDFIIIGKLEREKYQNINEELLRSIGEYVLESGNTAVYEIE